MSMDTMLEYIDDQRSPLIGRLQGQTDPEKIRTELDTSLVRMLTAFNESCPDERLREYASAQIMLLRNSLSLIDSAGEIKVLTRMDSGSAVSSAGGKKRFLQSLLTFGGIAALVVSGALLFADGSAPVLSRVLEAVLLPAAGGGCLYLAGRGSTTAGTAGTVETQLYYDPEKIVRHLRAAVMTIDKNLADLAASDKARERSALKASAPMLPDEKQLTLYAALLEAGSSGDADTALEAVETLRYYLHSQGIETVNADEGREEWFEYMPAAENVTWRPALVRDGKLLKKGLAGRAG